MRFQPGQQAYVKAAGYTSTSNWVLQDRDPTANDTNYSIPQVWQNTTTKVLWFLNAFSSANAILQAEWIQLEVNGAADSFAMQTGTSPVVPDASGLVTFNGAVVSAGTNPVRTDGTGANTMALEVQISQAIAAPNAANIGLSAFNNAQFSVDSTGYVSLLGGGLAIDSVGVDGASAPGTNPVVPTVAGQVNITGGQVAAGTVGTNVIRQFSTAANQWATQIQRSTMSSSSTLENNGVSHFNSSYFNVDCHQDLFPLYPYLY